MAQQPAQPPYRSKVAFTIFAVLCSPAVLLPFLWALVIGPSELLGALGVPRAVVLAWSVFGFACAVAATVWVFRRVWRTVSKRSVVPPQP